MKAVLILALAACGAERSEPRPVFPMPPATTIAPLARANNALAISLWKTAAQRPGNIAMSPASISLALAMTLPGGASDTAVEIQQVSGLERKQQAITWGKLAAGLQSGDRKLELRIANRMFGQRGYRFEQPFLDIAKHAFDAPFEPVDFKTQTEAARATINRWVEQRTARKIKELLPVQSIDDTTRLVIANAIYFYGRWAAPFEERLTSNEPFHVTATTQKSVPTMHHSTGFRYAKVSGAAVLELSYEYDEAAMLVVVPDRVDGLAELEASLDATTVAAWSAALQPQTVDVALPRFKIDPRAPISLRDALMTLGMTRAFDPKTADFTPIATPPDPTMSLYISAILHKAYVNVDERGTEAAAATAVVVSEAATARAPGAVFKADHPFLFVIVDRPSGLVLFIGRVVDPTS